MRGGVATSGSALRPTNRLPATFRGRSCFRGVGGASKLQAVSNGQSRIDGLPMTDPTHRHAPATMISELFSDRGRGAASNRLTGFAALSVTSFIARSADRNSIRRSDTAGVALCGSRRALHNFPLGRFHAECIMWTHLKVHWPYSIANRHLCRAEEGRDAAVRIMTPTILLTVVTAGKGWFAHPDAGGSCAAKMQVSDP